MNFNPYLIPILLPVLACGTTTAPAPQPTPTPDTLEIERTSVEILRPKDGISSLYVLDTHWASVKIHVVYTTNNTATETVTLEYGIPDFLMQEKEVSLRGVGPIFKFPLAVSFMVADAPANFFGNNINETHIALPDLPVTDLVVPVSVAGAATEATRKALVGAVIEADAFAAEISKKLKLAELEFPNGNTCVELGQAVTATIDDQAAEIIELVAGKLQSCHWFIGAQKIAGCDATLEPETVAQTEIQLQARYPELTLSESYR